MADVGGLAGDRLRSLIERIERLEEEKAALTADIREVYAEAKGSGFDVKIMRQIIRDRRMDAADLQERETLLDLYRRALGVLADTPLGASSLRRAAEDFASAMPRGTSLEFPSGARISKGADGRVTAEAAE